MEPNAVVRALIRDRAKLLGYIWVIVRDHHVAEDVFADVTVLAMERAGEINDEKHLALWARKAARLKALEAMRRRNRRGMVSLDDDVLQMIETDWGEAVDGIATSAEVDHLRSCIERLTPRARRILHLRYVEGLGGASLAAHEDVGIDLRSLYVAMSRIHKALHDCIVRKRAAERG
jgi:RNA polymerase sigma factor (sigma-70 family)